MLKRRSSGKKTPDLLLFVDTIMDGCNFKFLMTVVTVCSVECGMSALRATIQHSTFIIPLYSQHVPPPFHYETPMLPLVHPRHHALFLKSLKA